MAPKIEPEASDSTLGSLALLPLRVDRFFPEVQEARGTGGPELKASEALRAILVSL